MRQCKRGICLCFAVLLLCCPFGPSLVSSSAGETVVDDMEEKYNMTALGQQGVQEEKNVTLSIEAFYQLQSEADRITVERQMARDKYRYFTVYGLTAAAVLSLFIVLLFVVRAKKYSSDDIVNATALIFIIFGTIIVVVIADVDEQLTAAVGILGAIAGYLFGTLRRGSDVRVREDEGGRRASMQDTSQY